MSRIKQLIFEDGHEAYVSLFVVFVAVILIWSVQFVLSIQIKVDDQVNVSWLTLLNMYANGYLLFVSLAVIFGLVTFSLAMGSFRRMVIVLAFLVIIGFFGLMAFALGMRTTYTYNISTSSQYRDKNFKVIHAFQNGDMIADADYLLLECNLIGSDCKVTDKFEDYRCCGNISKPVSFYIEPSDNALYIKVGDETKLVSKA